VSAADSKHDSPSAAPPPIATPADEPAAQPEVSELQTLKDERDKFKDQLLRTAADFENFRKRSRKDVEDAERRGKEEAVRELLPVIDNLERAVAAAAAAKDIAAVIDGVKMVLRLFEDQASRLGLARVTTVGERFDPSIHDAIQHKETDESPAGTVVAEIVAGWRLGEKLVRPAMVVVAKKPTASA
jgi:molecular chaperone GrpE